MKKSGFPEPQLIIRRAAIGLHWHKVVRQQRGPLVEIVCSLDSFRHDYIPQFVAALAVKTPALEIKTPDVPSITIVHTKSAEEYTAFARARPLVGMKGNKYGRSTCSCCRSRFFRTRCRPRVANRRGECRSRGSTRPDRWSCVDG